MVWNVFFNWLHIQTIFNSWNINYFYIFIDEFILFILYCLLINANLISFKRICYRRFWLFNWFLWFLLIFLAFSRLYSLYNLLFTFIFFFLFNHILYFKLIRIRLLIFPFFLLIIINILGPQNAHLIRLGL